MNIAPSLPPPPAPGKRRRIMVMVLTLALLSACTPASQSDEELRKDIQGLKAQVAALQEKLNQMQAKQQTILDLLQKPPLPPEEPVATPAPPATPEPLTVAQLLESKDRYLGTRVTVRGMVGPVMVHHKSLLLKSPQGMVEVLFGNLPDPKVVQSISSGTLDKPITVTGVVNLPPARAGGAQIQIDAEAVEF